jgi:hypothetical protein
VKINIQDTNRLKESLISQDSMSSNSNNNKPRSQTGI